MFGFKDSWNGVGIFVFHDGSNIKKTVWRLTVIENFGTTQYTEDHVRQASTQQNSCELDYVNTGTGKFFLKIHMKDKKMTINYGRKNSQIKPCLENMYVENWRIKGYMGITARNPTKKLPMGKKKYSDIDLKQIQFINNDARYYQEAEIEREQNEKDNNGEEVDENAYWMNELDDEFRLSTEDIGSDAIDLLFGIRAKEDQRLKGTLEKDLAQVDMDDEKDEMLYKMYE